MWPHFLEFKPLQLNNVAKTGKQCGHVNAELSREEIAEAAIAHLKQMGIPETLFANAHAPTPDANDCAAGSQNTVADAPKLPKQIPLSNSKNSALVPDRLGLPGGPQTRAALSLLGLAIGDCAGLPFELTNGIAPSCTPAGMGPARETYKRTKGMASRKHLVMELIT